MVGSSVSGWRWATRPRAFSPAMISSISLIPAGRLTTSGTTVWGKDDVGPEREQGDLVGSLARLGPLGQDEEPPGRCFFLDAPRGSGRPRRGVGRRARVGLRERGARVFCSCSWSSKSLRSKREVRQGET